MFDFCLAPDTSGDGTGCDNMTCVIVKLHHDNVTAKRPASEDISGDAKKVKDISGDAKKVKDSSD